MVVWKKLGSLCTIKTGKLNANAQVENGKYPFFTCDASPYRIDDYAFDTEAILISGNGSQVGHLNYYKGRFNAYQRTYVLDAFNEANIFYLLHYMKGTIKPYVMEKSKKGSVPYITLPMLQEFSVPLPTLSEQTRIVGILDTFTASIENLKEQIAERRKQYEHYRDQFLDLEGKEDIVSWGDVCEMIKGNGVQKVDFVESGRGCIHYGQIYTHYGSFTYTTNKYVSEEIFEKAKKASNGDLIMTDTSENVEDICKTVAYLGEEDIAVSNHALIIKHKQNPKFLSFSTQTNSFLNQKRKVVVGVKVSGIKPEHLAQIKIYLPSFEEQSRIVSILDTFEASIQNLEAQLKEREKQYEYYRNKLLTFE